MHLSGLVCNDRSVVLSCLNIKVRKGAPVIKVRYRHFACMLNVIQHWLQHSNLYLHLTRSI
jgi:hypothetical protein